MIELEKTYLIKYLPKDYKKYPKKEIIDVYFPKGKKHPTLRLRKNGTRYEMTKKSIVESDPSEQKEETISLTKEEFNAFAKIPGKAVHKLRYYYIHNGWPCEIDIFQKDLKGMILVDFEFDTGEQKRVFQMPDFCLADVTAEKYIAGGMLAGKKYKEVEPHIRKLFGYLTRK
jgi:adenylate cyclase